MDSVDDDDGDAPEVDLLEMMSDHPLVAEMETSWVLEVEEMVLKV